MPQKQEELLTKLTALHPEDEQIHVLLGVYDFGRGDFQEAIWSLERSTKVNPDYPPPYTMLGYSYRSLEKYPEAEKAFKPLAGISPGG
jgi:uncharacterized protein HemY